MIKILMGNKAYSSWSLRAWLGLKQSGLPFEEVIIPMSCDSWASRIIQPDAAPAGGKVPILWDGELAIWDSMAIIEWLAEKTDKSLYWPKDDAARAMARSMAAEMHSSYANLRRERQMDLRKTYPTHPVSPEVQEEIDRILDLWVKARTLHGTNGPYLFSKFGAADMMFAPVVTRFKTFSIPVPPIAAEYMEAIMSHPFMQLWVEGALREPWVIEKNVKF